jgi:Reverse transcriptase (RNA-dependent DNA polymerase)
MTRFSEHTDRHNLLPSPKLAHRANYSTETAVIAVHDSIVRAIDSGEVVLLDFSSAFDTIDYETLLHVFSQRFDINDLALTWFNSYLTGSTQMYHPEDQQSQMYAVNCSVPQELLCHKNFLVQ